MVYKTAIVVPDSELFQMFLSKCGKNIGEKICGEIFGDNTIPQLISMNFHIERSPEPKDEIVIEAKILSRETDKYSRDIAYIEYTVLLDEKIISVGNGAFVAQPIDYFNKKGRKPL